MAGKEAKVKVRLDTKQAKGDLRDLTRDAAQAAGRVGGTIRGAVGKGLGVVGLGGGIGAGLAAVRGSTSSGFGDVIGESLGGIGAQLAESFLGNLDEDARATKSAREETIQAFGSIAGSTKGGIPPGAQNYFNQIKSLRLQEEKGKELFERDERFRGPGVEDMIDRIMSGLGEMVSKAVQDLKNKLNPFSGGK